MSHSRAERRPDVLRDRLTRLHYRVLRHLDLGATRSNLYDPNLPQRPWVEPLVRAYRASNATMLFQVLPLVLLGCEEQTDVETAVAFIERETGERPLAEALRQAYDALSGRDDLQQHDQEAPDLAASFGETLHRLREKLWEKLGDVPPPLTLVDAPVLATPGGWTRGRACSVAGRRLVAVALQIPWERTLVQVFHEEVHPVTDPAVDVSNGKATTIESVAVEVGECLVEVTAPELAETYAQWRARFEGA